MLVRLQKKVQKYFASSVFISVFSTLSTKIPRDDFLWAPASHTNKQNKRPVKLSASFPNLSIAAS